MVKAGTAIAFACFAMLVALPAPAAVADSPPPTYSGDQSFPPIQDSSGPEEFHWQVSLGGNQELVQVDEKHAEVRYRSGISAFTIEAERAHDMQGTEVPTSIAISEGDILTLVVHHRAGNPLTEGAPFDYPIFPGPGFVVTFTPPVIVTPPPKRAAEAGPGPVAVPSHPGPRRCGKGRRRVSRHGRTWCRRIGHRLHHGTSLAAT